MQHALLGHVEEEGEKKALLLNAEHPWSAFICGSQGSGKSYSTSVILEGLLSAGNNKIGTVKQAMAGLVFHYDRYGANVCEAATLCSGKSPVKVVVLVSPSNFQTLADRYLALPYASENIQVKVLYIKSSHLNAERIQKFMACGDGTKPLYMSASHRKISFTVKNIC